MKSMKVKGLMIALLVPLMFIRCGEENSTPQPTTSPELDFTSVEKSSTPQTSVSFEMKNKYAKDVTWKVYATNTDQAVMQGVTLTLKDSTLTLSHKTDIPAQDFYITATEFGKIESSPRLKITITDQAKTATPMVAKTSVTKTSTFPQTSVIFTLTNSPMYENAKWMVYVSNDVSDTPVDGVVAVNSGDRLLLTHEKDIMVMDYWVSAKEPDKAESARLKVTVNPYDITDKITATPEAFVTSVAKTSDSPQRTVSFNLTGTYTEGTMWKVYTTPAGNTLATGMTAMNSGTTLMLMHDTDVPTVDYYVSATEIDKSESAGRLKLTVTPYVQPQTATPTVASNSVAKATATQTMVAFTLTNNPMYVGKPTWNAYAAASSGGVVSGVSVENSGTRLTLTHSSDFRPGSYYVAATEVGKRESERTLLTVTTSILNQTATPVVVSASVTKTAAIQASVVFTLSTGFSGAKWNVYTSSTGEGASDVKAASSGTTLTLSHTTDVPHGEYWVTATESGKAESVALKLTVIPYVAPGQTPTPTADIITISKATATQNNVIFTLTNTPPYTNTTWKVYDTAAGADGVSGITASNNGAALTLRHSNVMTPLPEREYFVAATTSGLTESNRLKLRVAPPVEAVDALVTTPLDLTALVTVPKEGAIPQSVFPDQTQYTGTIAWTDTFGLPAYGTFEVRAYKAILTLTPKPGFTFIGMPQNHFIHNGANGVPTNATNSGIVTITFAGLDGTTITTGRDLTSLVTAPEKVFPDDFPDLTLTSSEYTGVIEWKDANDVPLPVGEKFAGSTVYKAVVSLTAKPGYTFIGVPTNWFQHLDALMENYEYQVTNVIHSGRVTIIFPATPAMPPTSDQVKFERYFPTDATVIGGETIRSVAANVKFNTEEVQIQTTKAISGQILTIGGTDSSKVSLSFIDPKISRLIVDTRSVQGGGSVRFSVTVSEPGRSSIVYNVGVNVGDQSTIPTTTAVNFTLNSPSLNPGLGNTIATTDASASQKTVTVNVANNTDTVKVNITGKTAAQSISIAGNDAIFVEQQGTDAAPVIKLDATIRKEGGTMSYTVIVSEPGKSPLVYTVMVTVASSPPTTGVTFSLNSPTGAGNTMVTNGSTSTSVGVNVVNYVSSVRLNVINKKPTQWITIGGAHAADVVVDTTTVIPTIELSTTDVQTLGGSKQYTLTLSESGKSSITYVVTVNVARGADTNNVTFVLKEPTPGNGNSLTGGGAQKAVNITVNRKTTKVVIGRTMLATQWATIGGAGASYVTTGGTNTAAEDVVDVSHIMDGGDMSFHCTISEAGQTDIKYIVTLTVRAPAANMTFTMPGSNPVNVDQDEDHRLVDTNVPDTYSQTVITGTKTATQTVAVSGLNASDVSISYAPAALGASAPTVNFTTNTTSPSGSKFFLITVSESGMANIVYPVMIHKEPSTTPVTFTVSNPPTGYSSSDKIIEVNVPNNTPQVVLTGTTTANQTIAVWALNGSSVAGTVNSSTPPTVTMDITSIAAGGTLQYVFKVSETGMEDIFYIVKVNVAAP